MSTTRSARWRLAAVCSLTLPLAVLAACASDSSVNDTDQASLSVDGAAPVTIKESQAGNFYGGDPLVAASRLTAMGTRTFAAVGVDGVDDGYQRPGFESHFFRFSIDAEGEGSYDVVDFGFIRYGDGQQTYVAGGMLPGSAGTIQINQYGGVDKRIAGEFEGFLVDPQTFDFIQIVGGFSMTREVDDWDLHCPESPSSGKTHYVETRPQLPGQTSNTQVYVFDGDGAAVCGNEDGGTSQGGYSQLKVKLRTGDTYYALVTGQTPGGAQPYALWATTTGFDPSDFGGAGNDIPSDLANDDPAGADALTVDGAVFLGLVEDPLNKGGVDDEDWFIFVAN